MRIAILSLFVLVIAGEISFSVQSEKKYHRHVESAKTPLTHTRKLEKETNYWISKAQSTLDDILHRKINNHTAKNIILFLGDGMGLSTTAATRMAIKSEETELSFEKFPHVGLTKTYCVNRQTPDSACTSTAYLNGVKGNYGTIGVNAKVTRKQCDKIKEEDYTESILSWAQKAGKATGIVTTSRITHASPCGAFCHTADRYWESDVEIRNDKCDPNIIDDVAEQLVHGDVGKKFKVILGGGRGNFRNETVKDEEGYPGVRADGKDLIEEWKQEHESMGKAAYVWNKHDLFSVDIDKTDYLMGLFEPNHLMYQLEVDNENRGNTEPSLSELTKMAIKMLQKEDKGFFLFVEGAKIDMGHHSNKPRYALTEVIEFAKAVEAATLMTDERDTLIVATADHSHSFTYNGYPDRGNDIFGINEISKEDGLPTLTLSYANGKGYDNTYHKTGGRKDVRELDLSDPETRHIALVPRSSETHAAEDVGIWASGPQSHLFVGVYEQSYIPIIMANISKIGPYSTGSGNAIYSMSLSVLIFIAIILIFKN